MSILRMKEGETEIPDGWEDKTIHLLTFPAGAKEPVASISINRSSADGAAGLGDYIDTQLGKMIKLFPRFSLLFRESIAVDEKPAERLAFTWRSEKGATLRQEQTIVMPDDDQVLIFTATSPKEKHHLYREAYRDIIDKYRFSGR